MATILNLRNNRPNESKAKLIRDTAVEFVATTVFVYAGTLSAVSTGKQQIEQGIPGFALARILPVSFVFGISIMALAFSIGHLSGGHMNPGVSLMMFFKCQIGFKKMILYWLAQFSGALFGAAIMWGSVSGLAGMEMPDGSELAVPPFNLGANGPMGPYVTTGNAFLVEFVGSFFFFLVIAQTACDNRGTGGTLFPAIPIGFILIVVHICLIPFTGCGVNPARTFGPSVVACMVGPGVCDQVANQEWYWVFYIAPFLASFAVAEVTYWMSGKTDEPSDDHEE